MPGGSNRVIEKILDQTSYCVYLVLCLTYTKSYYELFLSHHTPNLISNIKVNIIYTYGILFCSKDKLYELITYHLYEIEKY